MSGPKILVLIPSYNHAGYLAARIRSVLEQDIPASEATLDVRLIDDGSTDGTMDILTQFTDSRFNARRRETNSGSPFTAWLDACDILRAGHHDYIWIAESDDRAELDFLRYAVKALQDEPDAVLYYTHSWFVDERDLIIGHSINYLKAMFPEMPWTRPATIAGRDFVARALLRGMAIPNMSSALIRASAFCAAISPNFIRYRLAADWLFAIAVSQFGKVLFDPRDANHFRHHERTARSETDNARVVAEHMSATRMAYLTKACDEAAYRAQMHVWGGMYRHEKVRKKDFMNFVEQVSPHELNEFLAYIP